MNDFEKMIWAAAFVNRFEKEKHLVEQRSWESEIDAFTCAEAADEVVLKFREVESCEDKKYLLMYEEGDR